MIKKIKVLNFKSIKSLEIELSNLNVIIGQNASGKSNFVSVFQFIRDMARDGLLNAISLHGGIEYLINFNSASEEPLEIEITFEKNRLRFGTKLEEVDISFVNYKLMLFPSKGKKGLKKYKEEVTVNLNSKGKKEEIIIVSDNGHVNEGNQHTKLIYEIFPLLHLTKSSEGKKNKITMAELPPLSFIMGATDRSIQIYDFDPKLSKKAIPIAGRADLESDGSNIALLLKGILSDTEKRKRFLRYLRICLPFIKEILVEPQADKSLLFKTIETYNSRKKLPAALISDGTIEIISIIYVLFFESNQLIVIEEPERDIHPRLISNLVPLFKEASQKKQIIITTHNPEILREVSLENIFLMSRDSDGDSKITKASTIKELKEFIKDNIDIGDIITDGIFN
ncbi:AAA family ATPase [Caldiplasma sukawensis]